MKIMIQTVTGKGGRMTVNYWRVDIDGAVIGSVETLPLENMEAYLCFVLKFGGMMEVKLH